MSTKLDLSPGSTLWLDSKKVVVKAAADLEHVLVEDQCGAVRPVPISALSSGPASDADGHQDLVTIPAEEWAVARRREEVVRPLVGQNIRTRAMVEAAGKALGVSRTVVYRLIARYLENPKTTTLLPQKGGKARGLKMVSGDVEKIMEATIEEFFLSRQKVRGADVAEEVRRRCLGAGLKPPGVVTVYRRIRVLPPKAVLKAREGTKAAQDRYLPAIGHFPETAWPLQVIQIDHTPVDAIVVDQTHRKPIGRPWLTLAIDIHSRMVVGFLLSLDDPQATSVALCLTHAVLPKEDWLARRKIDAKWPVWGLPDTIHVDNGKDFHSEALTRGCAQYGIALDYRPVRTPSYGGHIERLIGTMMGKVHLLPGTTFSNIQQKGDYDPEKHACMTLSELEEWLAIGVDVYHRKIHSALGLPPLAAWERGILGTADQPGRGLPARIADPQRFLIDFLPLERRAVTREGVQISHIFYWSDVLRPLIKDGEKYLVRYDPRDLSRIWLLSKDGEYYQLPYRARHRPPISLWEHKLAHRHLLDEGRRHVDETAIFDQIERMRRIVDEAAATTKKARRQSERRRQSPKVEKVEQSKDVSPAPVGRRTPKPFDVEEW